MAGAGWGGKVDNSVCDSQQDKNRPRLSICERKSSMADLKYWTIVAAPTLAALGWSLKNLVETAFQIRNSKEAFYQEVASAAQGFMPGSPTDEERRQLRVRFISLYQRAILIAPPKVFRAYKAFLDTAQVNRENPSAPVKADSELKALLLAMRKDLKLLHNLLPRSGAEIEEVDIKFYS